jgi:predicted restriction endonuclease
LNQVRKPDIGLPFFHLKGDSFWHHQPKPGFEAVIASGAKIRTLGLLRETVQYAYFDEELFALLVDPSSRGELTDILIHTWFSDKTQEIERLLQVDAFGEIQERLRSQGGRALPSLKNWRMSRHQSLEMQRFVRCCFSLRIPLLLCAGLQILNSLVRTS